MLKRGDVFDNPITGERATIRLGTRETRGDRLVVDLDLRGAGFGSPLQLNTSIHERLRVVSGSVGISIAGRVAIADVGKTIEIPPGAPHRFWNAGIIEAKVMMDIRPANRFEAFTRNMIGLAQDGKTNPKGMPNLLQLALIAKEFSDVIQFLSPPRFLQAALFPILAPMARMRDYRGSYSEYVFRLASERNEGKTPMLEHS
jgi:mannose-6-phosphate isomerase-like protein (cupin superfamily)